MRRRNAPFEFTPQSSNEPKKQPPPNPLHTVLDENGLVIKETPEAPGSLMKALSDAIYFTGAYHEKLQEQLIQHLIDLIATDALPPRLSMFKGNNMLWKDYSSNPTLTGFDKINLELVSSMFKTKIVVYSVTDDNYLNAMIINNYYKNKKIMLAKERARYSSVYRQEAMKSAGICQNIVLNIISKAIENKTQFINQNNDQFISNYYSSRQVPSPTLQAQTYNDVEQQLKPRHKKSLSDGFDLNFDQHNDQSQMRVYNLFAGSNDEFFRQIVRSQRKDTVDSNLARNACLDFIDDDIASPKKEYALPNYQIDEANVSSNYPSMDDLNENHQPSQNTDQNGQDADIKGGSTQNPGGPFFFGDGLALGEIEKMESGGSQKGSQIYYDTPHMENNPTLAMNGGGGSNGSQSGSQNADTNIANNHAHSGGSGSFVEINNGGPSTSYADGQYQGGSGNENIAMMSGNNYNNGFNQYGGNGAYRQGGSPDRKMNPNGNYGKQQQQQGQQSSSQFQNMNMYNQQGNGSGGNQLYSKRTGSQGKPLHFTGGSYDDFNLNPHQMNDIQYYQQRSVPIEKKKPMILEESHARYTGRLKFFDENKNYGFIIMDDDGSDIFVHYDDLSKAGIGKDLLKTAKAGAVIKLAFTCMKYLGKYDKSRKATDIELLNSKQLMSQGLQGPMMVSQQYN